MFLIESFQILLGNQIPITYCTLTQMFWFLSCGQEMQARIAVSLILDAINIKLSLVWPSFILASMVHIKQIRRLGILAAPLLRISTPYEHWLLYFPFLGNMILEVIFIPGLCFRHISTYMYMSTDPWITKIGCLFLNRRWMLFFYVMPIHMIL